MIKPDHKSTEAFLRCPLKMTGLKVTKSCCTGVSLND